MKVYYVPKKIIDYDAAKLLTGLRDHELIPVKTCDIPPLDPSFFVVSDVHLLDEICISQQIRFPKFPMFPSWLADYYGGTIESYTWEEMSQRKGGPDKFVKPHHKNSFRPFISAFPYGRDINPWEYMHVSEKCPVYIRNVLDIKQEWRVVICDGEIVDICSYSRKNEFCNPDYDFIKEVVAKCIDNFVVPAFCVDVGLLENNTMVVIELTPGIAFGSYGLSPIDYARVQTTSWEWNVNYSEKI